MTMMQFNHQPYSLLGLCVLVLLSACSSPDQTQTAIPLDEDLPGTVESDVAITLQADTDLTAAWVATNLPQATATDEPLPVMATSDAVGTPASARTGPCEPVDGMTIEQREGFCLTVPETWTIQNVDGGLAAFLGTTPGQAIGLQPDWAGDPEICQATIYIAPERSVEDHLGNRYSEFANRADLNTVSPIENVALGELLVTGFSWTSTGDRSGSVYAALIGQNRLVHMSYSGTACQPDQLFPVFESLRFNST